MSSLVPVRPSPIAVMGDQLLRGSMAHPLPPTGAGHPRTTFLFRMLSGAAETDCLLGHLLALPFDPDPVLAHAGGPAGPSFKAHSPALRARFDSDDADLMAKLIDFRMEHPAAHLFASFDPECIDAGLRTLQSLRVHFNLAVDNIFVTSRTESVPKFVERLQSCGDHVIHAHPASLRPVTSGDVLSYPAVSPTVEREYAQGKLSLRTIVNSSSFGVRVAFEENLAAFRECLGSQLYG